MGMISLPPVTASEPPGRKSFWMSMMSSVFMLLDGFVEEKRAGVVSV